MFSSAYTFVDTEESGFDLVRILPGLIQGANELAQTQDEAAAGSNVYTMDVALGRSQPSPRVTAQVLLDDVAKAHVLALDPRVAGHHDNLLVVGNGGVGTLWDDYAKIVEQEFPAMVASGVLSPVSGQQSVMLKYDVSGSEKALGFQFAGPERMVKSVVGQYLELR